MIACIDVDYRDSSATAACVCIDRWSDSAPRLETTTCINDVAPYRSGSFYRRELPCILAVLASLPAEPQVVVVDGYVWLGNQRPGLGKHLYDALKKQVAVIGVAKTRFEEADPVASVLRGDSRTPLYISAAGIDLEQAARHIEAMHGCHRIPTILKRVDQLCRRASSDKESGC